MSDLTPVNLNILICRMTAETDHVWASSAAPRVHHRSACGFKLVPLIFHLIPVTHTRPTSEEPICLYYHILNGSKIKGLLVIMEEGVGLLQGPLGMLMSAGS